MSTENKIAIVTGANTGLGFHTTGYLAEAGYHVVMACRSKDRADDAKAKILNDQPDAKLEVMLVDLSDMSSVRHFANAYRAAFDRVDLLVNNAGIMWVPYSESVDGFESHMAANHFGHFLLTALLFDLMPNDPSARVVNVSSLAHFQGKGRIIFEDIHLKEAYNKYEAYAQSKLANMLFTLELDRRLKKAGRRTLAVAAHPGMSETELVRTMKRWQVALIRYTIGPFLSHPPHEAARPTVMTALETGLQGGEYFGPQGMREMSGPPGPAKIHDCAKDEEAAAKLWSLSEELVGTAFAP